MLELSDIRMTFKNGLLDTKGRKILDGVNFSIGRDEVVGIIGQSGSGKTTLARIAVRLINPDGGRIVLDGEDISGLSYRQMMRYRSRLQMIFQHPEGALNPEMTLGGSLRESILKSGLKGKTYQGRLTDICSELGIKMELLDRYPMQVSGGEIQRVAIARALAFEPDYMFMDEPTSMLDASVQAQILSVLMERKRRSGMGLILITHDLDIVRHVCDRLVVIDKGAVITEGAVDEVLSSEIPYIRGYCDAWDDLKEMRFFGKEGFG